MIFAERRLAAALSVFMLTVFFLRVLEYKFITAAVIISAVLTAAFIALRFSVKNLKSFCALAVIFNLSMFAALLFCFVHYNIYQKPVLNYAEKYGDNPVYIKAEIKNASSLAFMSSFDLKVLEINGEKVRKFNLLLDIYGEVGADYDEIDYILETYIIFKSLLDDVPSSSSGSYYKSGGYYISAEHADITNISNADEEDEENQTGDRLESPAYKITPPKSRSLNYYLELTRRRAGNIFFRSVKIKPGDYGTTESAVVYGIFTGNKNYIPQNIINDFRKSGIAHILAVSGMHLAILCGIIFELLNYIKTHKKIICMIIILFCLIFMAFTGFSVSVIRAGIMTVLFYSAFLLGRKSDPLTSLLIAGVFIVLLNPNNILNTGFQLSFSATLGIILIVNNGNVKIPRIAYDRNRRLFFRIFIKILNGVISVLAVTVAATLFTLPFAAYNFKALSLVSPIANIIAAPLVTAILFLSLCIMIFSLIMPFAAGVFAAPAYFITKILLSPANYLASLKYSYISVESTNFTGFYYFAAALIVMIIFCFLFKRRLLYFLTVIILIITSGTLIYPRIIFKDSVRFAYYSDYRNQNIIIFNKDYDSADIIDITHGNLAHIRPVYNIISRNGAMRINSLILTDYRKRHVQMIRRYFNYSEIKKVYVPAPLNDYDFEVLNMIYNLTVTGSLNFELINYGNLLKSDNILINIKNFEYNKMAHTLVEIDIDTENTVRKLLYLGIGYKEGYEIYTDTANNNYDIVFYGSHKHNLRDDDYITDTAGSYAGVLSEYLDNNKNITSQKLEKNAVVTYLSDSVLFLGGESGSPVFEAKKTGVMKYYLK